jgi:two-component system, OmpR family, osmolarity sensor histidine kinase EnvZ
MRSELSGNLAAKLAGVSHDIRTPLARLRVAIEVLAGRDEQLVNSVHRQVDEIDRLLDQFLVFAKGAESEAVLSFDLDALVSEVLALKLADGIDISHEGDRLGKIEGRPESVRRALINLVENALRHGASPVRIRTSIAANQACISVEDSGPGVSPDLLDRLATPFIRGDNAGIRGSGLGLAIAAQAARIHSGHLDLKNLTPAGFGATLTLALAQAPRS